ncbi:MAG: hypothetical protein AVDCRST_MAG11-1120, partial [uncultured Gemmatimonadaceae bacterium]
DDRGPARPGRRRAAPRAGAGGTARADGRAQPAPGRGGGRRQAARRRAHRARLPVLDGARRGLPALELPHHRRGLRARRLLRRARHRERRDHLHPARLLPARRAAGGLV